MRLQVNNINQQFVTQRGTTQAIDNVSFTAQPGEFVCLVGPSGCGKSTLLSLISGLEQPTSGNIKVEGKVGFMFQEAALFPWLKVKDNVAFGLKLRKLPKAEQDALVDKYLNMVHLSAFAEAYPHELSGGMKQRVALVRTLVLEPDILLMDEPFAALDAQTRELLYKELQDIWQLTKKTIIFVTHNVREAVCLGDRVIVFTARPGKIKREFKVDLPRPRDLGNFDLVRMSNDIMAELKDEISKVAQAQQTYEKTTETVD
jgi:NitT/TauT family transport system ATP-binding protein